MDLEKALILFRPGLVLLERISGIRVSPQADQMLLTIALQESGLKHRYQVLSNGRPGPARGWWQFERMGGVAGVLAHASTAKSAAKVCAYLEVNKSVDDVWRALEGNDALAVCFARLLLWSDPRPLPTQSALGWGYYLDNWRPGKPHAETWPGHWKRVAEFLEDWGLD